MKQLIFIIAALIPSMIFAQQNAATADTTKPLFTYVDPMPDFPGGQAKLMKFIQHNLRYPPEARERNIQGSVLTQFIVKADGTLTDFQVIRSLGGGCDEEALRVLQMMPKWIPGKQNGKPMDVYFKMPITFRLGD